MGLGFGIHADKAMQAGGKGVLLTVFSIALTLTLGAFLGRRLTVDKKTSYLIASGTAICGGSAIAAVSPLVKAEDSQISLALGTVFILNAAALFIFPPIGHALGLSQVEFGTWAAIAIHDTSSVVGAAAAYGPQAEATATTLKLARALWIIPLSVFTLWAFKSKGGEDQNSVLHPAVRGGHRDQHLVPVPGSALLGHRDRGTPDPDPYALSHRRGAVPPYAEKRGHPTANPGDKACG